MGGWLRARVGETWRALRFLAVGVVSGLIGLAMVPLVLITLIGWPLVPAVANLLRWRAGVERRRVRRFTGAPVEEHYRELTGNVPERIGVVVRDPAARRDLAWLVGHAFSAPIMGLLAIGLPLGAVNAVAIPFYWWAMPANEPASSLFPVTDWGRALATPLVGLAYVALALLIVPAFARVRVWWARMLLRPARGSRLSERVAELIASRAAALEAHGAELRRIERDLHDGTQNRLVGVVMHLGIAERALRRDPESALPLILRAQNAASDALSELRGVVRSIYPPVLTERGLDGAVAALVARCSVPCTLAVSELRRAPAAVESAAYFVVAEALTNVAKHSGANRAEVSLSTREGELLVIEVFDDGQGGASEEGGTGLLGIRRRVAAFDGRMTLVSPSGGPTLVTVELPCGS